NSPWRTCKHSAACRMHFQECETTTVRPLTTKLEMAATPLPVVSFQSLWPQLPWLLLLRRLLSFSPQRLRLRPPDFYLLLQLRPDESCDNIRSIWKAAVCGTATNRTARVYSARNPCPS